MKRLKAVLKRVFCLPPLLTVVIAVPSFAFVFVMLGTGDQSFLAYLSYLLSAYAMIITATGFTGVIRAVRNGVENLPAVRWIRSKPLGERLLDDVVFRSEVAVHGGLLVNILYVGLNLVSGIRYRSAWFISLAAYYGMLSAMRAVLVRYFHRRKVGEDIQAELKRYRACGVILLFMNQALIGIVVLMVTEGRGFSYAGYLIYAMALYTFYITISAAVNLIRFRKKGSPVLSAAKVINMTAALVSMLSLETAMLSQFGGEADFVFLSLSLFGGGVCAIVLGMAIWMIVRSNQRLKKLRQNTGKDAG